MAEPIDRDRFIAMLAERFPKIFEEIDECRQGLLHYEMGAFSHATQLAISSEDIETVKRHFEFISEVFRLGSPEMKNAVSVSYLEHLSFNGKHGLRIKARELLSKQLQDELRELEAHLARIFGKDN
jgi:hypothetical protein